MNRRGRDALVGLCFLVLVAIAVLATLRRSRSSSLGFTVERCLRDISDCRAEPYLDLLGAYVPGSQVWGEAGCAMRLELQAPHGKPPGRFRVCAEHALPKLDLPSADGGFLLHARGHFSGDRFEASAVLLVTQEQAR